MAWTLSRPTPPPKDSWRFRPAILDAFHGYTGRQAVRDVQAGVVVGVVALPLAIAFAIASGADPHAGLVTVVVAGILVALFGGTRFGVAGPTSSFVTVLYGIVALHGFEDLLLAAALAGAILVLAGVFRLGTTLKLIPYPVTTGFTAGIALTIFLGQVPDLLGLRISKLPAAPLERLAVVAAHAAAVDPLALAVGAGTILLLVVLKRYAPRLPGPIIALVGITAVVQILGVDVVTIGDKFGSLPGGLGRPRVPELSWPAIQEALPDALVIAFLCAVESLSTAVVADGMAGTRHDSNQELMGQGIANLVAPLFGGLPGVGAIARTATNLQAGARTPVAALVHSGIALFVLFVAGPWAALIPFAVLAGILTIVAWNISQRRRFLQFFRMPRADAAIMLGTFAITVVFNLAAAIVVGLLLSSAIFMRRMSDMAHVELVDPTKDEHPFGHNVREEDIPDGVLIYSIDGPFFFGAADRFQETMAQVSRAPQVVILRMRAVPYLDATGLNALEDAIRGLQKRGTRVMLAGIQTQPLDLMERSGAVHTVGDNNVFRRAIDALQEARRHLGITIATGPPPSGPPSQPSP
ncbi:MAG: SulP family inorganic anion transporter [Candidatus Thermoplasmatota archaeon]